MYSAVSHDDVKDAIDYIRKVRPNDNLIGYGVCMGAANVVNVSAIFFNISSTLQSIKILVSCPSLLELEAILIWN